MIKARTSRFTLGLFATTVLTSPAWAQQDPDFFLMPPTRQAIDQNGVDLAVGEIAVSSPTITIGSGAQGLSYGATLRQSGILVTWSNSFDYYISGTPTSTMTVGAGDRTVQFAYNAATGGYDNKQGSGETLAGSGTNWSFTLRDGTVVQMSASTFNPAATSDSTAVANTITFPNQQKLTLSYKEITAYKAKLDDNISHVRVQSVQSSNGYMAKLEYADNTTYGAAWNRVSKVTLLNLAVDYCNATADSCSFSTVWPSLTFTDDGAGTKTVVDTLNRTTTYRSGTGGVTAIRRPSSSSDNIVIGYDANGKVASVNADGRTWNYSWSSASPLMTATVTNPDATHQTIVTDTTINQIKSETDERGFTTSYTYDILGRLTEVQYPEGNKADYSYDVRGNVTQKKLISKTPGTPADIIVSAAYPSSCTPGTAVTCNKPTSTTDANGNVTTYVYDGAHGGLTRVTRPFPTATSTVRPQTRYHYSTYQAFFKNSSGSLVGSGQPTYLLDSISACQNLKEETDSPPAAAACIGSADEVRTTIGYGSQSGNVANNLLPASSSNGSGDGSLTAITSVAYDDVGNVISVDGPLSGSDDTTQIIYDAGRQVVGQIGPDPDGSANPLPNRAMRTTYNLDGQVTKLENGTAPNASWSQFTPAQALDVTYDAAGLETKRQLSAGGTIYALTQSSYDSAGRLHCSATRMNQTTFGSLPSSACVQGAAGADGPDRIGQYTYDAAGEPIRLEEAVGTASSRAERTLTYTPNGNVQTLKDAENNLTTYTYDGFDRLATTHFPTSTPKGAGTSDASNFEQLGYDFNGNVLSRRRRDGASIAYTYDHLNRVTFKDLPGSEPDVSYGYDNLGRLTSASQTGAALSFAWDALGRQSSETGPWGTNNYQYDLNGQKTYLNAGDYAIRIQRRLTGEATAVTDINGGPFASYYYNDLGNRSSLVFGSGGATYYAYDPVSRLNAQTIDLAQTASKLTIGQMSYNAASQITSAPRSNDIYAFKDNVNVNRNYTINGLNQYSTVGTNSYTYDQRGNLTSDGTTTFNYSSENLLTSTSAGVTLSYDPLGRLYQLTTPAGVRRFRYDGSELMTEYDGAGVMRSWYVHGPGTDEAIVWGDSTTGQMRYLQSDERGSVIAAADGSGSLVTANTYDEYGIPGSGNSAERLQYTGQMWLPEVGMYYYKARMYSATLGRFMQTDPIGYADGANWYAYVHDDPINRTDAWGLDSDKWQTPQSPPQTIVEVWGYKLQLPSLADMYSGTRRNVDSLTQQMRRLEEKTFDGLKNKCRAAGNSTGSNVVDRIGDAHGSIFAGAAASERVAGNAANARAIGMAGAPGAVVLGGLSEGIAAVQDHRDGMSASRSVAIHGTGFAGGLLGAFALGELVEPLGGGVIAAVGAGVAGGAAGTKAGEAAGGAGATAMHVCK